MILKSSFKIHFRLPDNYYYFSMGYSMIYLSSIFFYNEVLFLFCLRKFQIIILNVTALQDKIQLWEKKLVLIHFFMAQSNYKQICLRPNVIHLSYASDIEWFVYLYL